MTERPLRLAAIVLAAGAGSRFSGQPGEKLLAPIDGQPMLARVLETVRQHQPATTIVVLGHGAAAIESAIDWAGEARIHNEDPDRGVASSLKIGFDALESLPDEVDGAFVVLGDQPDLHATTMDALAHAAADPASAGKPLIVPRYADDPGPRNPVLVRRWGWPLIAEVSGDHGLAPFIAQRPELVVDVPVPGAMPDIDRPQDLEALHRSRP